MGTCSVHDSAVLNLTNAPGFYEVLRELADVHERALAAARREQSPACRSPSGFSHSGFSLILPDLNEASSSSQSFRSAAAADLPGQLVGAALEADPVKNEDVAPRTTEATEDQQQGGHSSNTSGQRSAWELLRVWDDDQMREVSSGHHRFSFNNSFTTHERLDTSAPSSTSNTALGHCVLHPGSALRVTWDLLGLVLLVYDLVMIPFSLAFVPPPTCFTTAMSYSTLVFWSLDILASMRTGYYDGKCLVLEPAAIFRKYLQTWFGLDALLISLDWLIFPPWKVDANGGSPSSLGRSLRVLRFARTLRLVRILKLSHIILDLQDQINSEAVSICFRVVKIIMFLLLANHMLACVWYVIGSSGVGTEGGLSSWVIEHDMDLRPLAYRYLTSLHWSLTQFTPASMEVVPESLAERLFAVGVLLFAMVAFSSFVSMLTSSMAQLRNINSNEMRQFWLLRRYLRDWNVSRHFALRLQRYVEYAYEQQKQRVQAKDVELLALLSVPLQDELRVQTLSATLITHPLFATNSKSLHIFSRSLSEAHLGRADCAFYCGERASSMIFICQGICKYVLGQLSIQQDFDRAVEQTVNEGQWVAEPVLWTRWMHLGDLQAATEGQVLLLNAQSFGQAVQVYRPTWIAFRTYAERFIKEVNNLEDSELSDLLHLRISSQKIADASGFAISSVLESSATSEDGLRRFSRALCSRLAMTFARPGDRGHA